jgi:hypothetical protein
MNCFGNKKIIYMVYPIINLKSIYKENLKMKFLLKVIAFFKCFKNNLVTQEFKHEGYSHLLSIPFIPCSIYFKGFKASINYRGVEFKRKRDDYMIKRFGMTWDEAHKPEHAHLFVAKISYKTV